MRHTSLLLLLVLASACGDASPTDAPDVGTQPTDGGDGFEDAGEQPLDGGDDAADAGEDTPDTGEESPDAGENAPDAGEDTPDAGEDTPDAGEDTPDAGATRTAPGQCGRDADCGTGDCNPRGPGGVCFGCESDADCDLGNGETYTCSQFFSCNQDCDEDADCPAGLRCHASQQVCVLAGCGDCPAPYVCEGTVCVRPPCDASCPSGACSEGYCVTDL